MRQVGASHLEALEAAVAAVQSVLPLLSWKEASAEAVNAIRLRIREEHEFEFGWLVPIVTRNSIATIRGMADPVVTCRQANDIETMACTPDGEPLQQLLGAPLADETSAASLHRLRASSSPVVRAREYGSARNCLCAP
jgi:hypothetical protein